MQQIIDEIIKMLKAGVYKQEEILKQIEYLRNSYNERNKQSKKVLQNKSKI